MTKLLKVLALLCVVAMLGSVVAFAEAAASKAPAASETPAATQAAEATAQASETSAANPDGTYPAVLLPSIAYTADQWLTDEGSRAYFSVLLLMDVSSHKELGLNSDIETYGLPTIYLTTMTAETAGSLTAIMFYEKAGTAWVCTYYPDAKTYRVESVEAADGADAYMEGLKTAGTVGEFSAVTGEAISYVLTQINTAISK